MSNSVNKGKMTDSNSCWLLYNITDYCLIENTHNEGSSSYNCQIAYSISNSTLSNVFNKGQKIGTSSYSQEYEIANTISSSTLYNVYTTNQKNNPQDYKYANSITNSGFINCYQIDNRGNSVEFSQEKINYEESTNENIVLLKTVEDWKNIANNVNNGIDSYEGKTIVLMKDLNFNNVDTDFICIGKTNSFKGTFDGNGYVIKNITSSTENGLFGKVENSTIKNVISLDNSFQLTNAQFGGLIQEGYNSTIKNIAVKGNSNISCEINAESYGAVIGYAKDSVITNCVNERNYESISGSTSNIAGILGKGDNIHISNCRNEGDFTSTQYNGNLAGIVGVMSNGGIVESCYNTGSLTSQAGHYVAGIVSGNLDGGIVKYCFNTGNIQSNSGSYGIIYTAIPSNNQKGSKIISCYNSGDIKCNAYANGIFYQANYATVTNCYNFGNTECGAPSAGIGYRMEYSKVTNCYNYGNVGGNDSTRISYQGAGILSNAKQTVIERCTNYGKINSSSVSSGILCSVDSNDSCTIINCSNNGEIYVKGNGLSTGIVSIGNKSIIERCFNNGSINGSNNDKSGIVGTMDKGKVSQCYNLGTFSTANKAGCVFSSNGCSINHCYNLADMNFGNIGGILYSGAADLIYCSNYGNLDNGGAVGGIAYSNTGRMIKCNNYGKINAGGGAGIVYDSSNSLVIDCHNFNSLKCSSIGGIACSSKNTQIIDCSNEGDLEGSSVAGIVCNCNGGNRIYNCYNSGNIESNGSGAGIVATTYSSDYIVNCYNEGNIHSYGSSSGIGGRNIENCYNKGLLSADYIDSNGNKSVYGITSTTNANVKNCYYLDTSAPEGQYNKQDVVGQCESITEEQLQSTGFVKELNNNRTEYTTTPGILAPWKYNENSNPTLETNRLRANPAIVVNKHKAELIITKVDADNPNQKLAGAEFKIEQATDDNITNLLTDENVKKGTYTYQFIKNGNVYQSNNAGQYYQTAASYITIDLTDTKDICELTVNASISSQANYDIGYASITNSISTPSYYLSDGRFIYISGEVSAKDYKTTLRGGKVYYLHLGYYKNGSVNSGDDKFTINSVKIKRPYKYYMNVTTNNNGEATAIIPDTDMLKIEEVKAPFGYELEDYTQEVKFEDKDINLTIKNKKVTTTTSRFTINKTNESGSPLAQVKFEIYKVNEQREVLDFAKDRSGHYLGVKENEKYIHTTDSQGKITVTLPEGYYKAVEVQSVEGYVLDDDENLRTIYFEIKDEHTYSSNIPEKTDNEGTIINISTIDKFNEIARKVNSGEDNYEGKTLKLLNDLDFENEEIVTIGTVTNSNSIFKGNFDGNNHKIKNATTDSEAGLFIRIEDSYIKDLTFENCNFNGGYSYGGAIREAYNSTIDSIKIIGNTNINNTAVQSCGTVVGYIENSTVKNCINERNFVENYSGDYVGGIVGKAKKSNIKDCKNKGNISASRSSAYIGGIVGIVETEGWVEGCENTGNILSTSGDCAAGIVSGTSSNVTIIDCINKGEMSTNSGSSGIAYNLNDGKIVKCENKGTITSSGYCGGLVNKLLEGKIENSTNSGAIMGKSAPVGGLASQISYVEIRNCSNSGHIETSSCTAGIVYEMKMSKLIDCFNTGEITDKEGGSNNSAGLVYSELDGSIVINCYNNGNVSGKNGAAGIAYNISDSSIIDSWNGKDINSNSIAGGIVCNVLRSIINNCYNNGEISSTNSPAGGIAYNVYDNSMITNCYNNGEINSTNVVGGIVENLSDSKILNCYNTGNVTSTSSPAGGIACSANGNSTIANCYNSGIVTTTYINSDTLKYVIGGIVQYIYGNPIIKNCYYLDSSAIEGVYDTEDIVGKYEKITIDQLKSKKFTNTLNQNKLLVDTTLPLYNWQKNEVSTINENGHPTLISNGFKTENQATIVNKKIPTLTIVKTDKDTGNPLSGAKFDIINTEDNTNLGTNLATNAQGKITVNLPSSGTIKITETKAPNGYIKLENSITVKAGKENINVDIKNKKAKKYTINKKDEETNEPIKGAKFVIYKIETPSQEDFAKDGNGNYIGTKEGNLYVLKTNNNGQINVELPNGVYRAVEVEAARGYEIGEYNEFIFEINNGTGSYKITPEESEDCYEVNYIEDILDLYKLVKDGDTFEGKTVKLMRDLDYEDDSSYKNPNTGFNEYIGTDSTSIKEMLVNQSGNFAVSIGNNVTPFKGIFDGNNKIISHYHYGIFFNKTDGAIIKNVTFKDVIVSSGGAVVRNATNTVIDNIKLENCSGDVMHGLVYESNNSSISNIKVTGTSNCTAIALVVYTANDSIITSCENDSQVKNATGYTGIIVSILNNSLLINCGNNGDILKINGGGVVGNSENSQMIRCYNTGNISADWGNQIGGLAETVKNTIMYECYNTGDIHGIGAAGGLAFSIIDSTIKNCYNSGNITGSAVSGGLAWSIKGSVINNCYNSGNINVSSPAGGLAYMSKNSTYVNSYNSGNLEVTSAVGGIVQSLDNCKIYNCYNSGNVKCTGSTPTAGIVQSATGSIDNCYNSGIVDTNYYIQNNDGTTKKMLAGVVLWKNDRLKLNNCYYSENSAPEGVFYEEDVPGQYEKVTLDELQSQEFVDRLNSNKASIESEYKLNDWILDGTPKLKASSMPVVTQDSAIMTNKRVGKTEYTVTVNHIIAYGEIVGGDNYEIEDWYKNDIYYYEEGSHYKVTPSQELLEKYDLVYTAGEEEGDINADVQIRYYYKIRTYNITTKVEIPEGRAEKGGAISGDITIEGNKEYETVDEHKNSTKDITIEPKPGYRVAQIRVISTDAKGNKTETIVYGEDADPKSEIKARKLRSGSMTLTNFVNVQADKEIIVQFEPDEGAVLVHHYIENTTEKISKDEYTKDMIGKTVETAPVDKERYVLVSGPEGEERTKTVTEELQEVTYYYQYEYRITTNVIEHIEKYKDGTVKTDVKGGTISGEDLTPYEGVLKGRDNTKDIVITPDDGYEIVKVTLTGEDEIAKDFDFKEIAKTNDKVIIDENGVVTIKGGFFENMQEDKHIEVEFRKKSKVIVKYLEEGTEKVLAKTEEDKAEFIQTGYEGKDFTTEHKIIPIYEDAKPEITIEDTEDFTKYDQVTLKSVTENGSKYAEGTMYADDITIIYWYKKIEADVIERHIEINEKKETTEIEHTTYTKKLEEEVKIDRNEYDGYIPVDGPSSSSDLVTVMKGTENTKTVTPVEGETVEVWYYYEKQFKITTEVKPHDETKVDETTGKETKVKVDGGTISKEYKKDEQGEYVLDDKGNKIEIDYEHVLNRGDATKEIVIEPEENYRVKSLTVNGNSVDFEKFKVDDTEKLIIPETYFKDIQENKHVVVEFEKIPAKVIVKYIDIDTKEEVLDEKVVEGGIKDPYNEPRVQVEGYIPAGEEPTNNKGTMTEETITVIYYYTKEYKITTEVKAHEEIEEKSIVDVTIEKSEEETNPSKKVVVKGGTITGELTEENKEPIEIVLRGKDSTKEIIMKPEKGYRIKSIKVLDGNREGAESDTHTVKEYEIDIKELYKKDGTAIIPEKYFKNMQADKHIIVEYEKIPSKLIVNYLEKGTEAIVADQEIGKGFVDYEYVTHEKEIPYYELLKDELPENAEGVLVEKDTIVNYWYRRLLFNMKITKEFTSILVNGNEKLGKDNKLAKVEIKNSDLANSSIQVKYKLTVTNTEEIAGIAVITEQIPEGFKLSEKSKAEWALTDGKYTLTTKELQPGERVEYEVILEWDKDAKYVGKFENISTIISTDNKAQFTEETLEDNQDSATLIIAIRTGGEITTLVISTVFIILLGILTILLIFKKTSTSRYVPKHY